LNLYGFVGNNPLIYIEPRGQIIFDPAWNLLRKLVGNDPVVDASNNALVAFLLGIPASYEFGPTHPWTLRLKDHPHFNRVREAIIAAMKKYCDKSSEKISDNLHYGVGQFPIIKQFGLMVLDFLSWRTQGLVGQDRAYVTGSFYVEWSAKNIDCCLKKADIDFKVNDTLGLRSATRIPRIFKGFRDNPLGIGRPLNNVRLFWYWDEPIVFE